MNGCVCLRILLKNSSMKLLFINANIGYGGASKIMVWLANKYSSVGYDVTFFIYFDKTENQPLSKSVKHVHFQWEDNNTKKIWLTIRELHKYIKKEYFDLALAFLSPSHFRLAFACCGTSTKSLFSQRGDPYQQSRNLKNRIIERINIWAFESADKYVFQTERAKEFYPRKIQNKSVVIANPIVPLQRTVEREGHVEKHIVNVSRLDIHQKRQDVLIKAFLKISYQYPDYTLDLYGDGEPEDERVLKELSQENPQVRFMGKTTNVIEAEQNATMFVLSSDYEGIPNALLEAMSLGVPCVSTDCSPGGAAMLINNYENGVIVDRGNDESLAAAMKWCLDNPEKREEMGAKGKNVNERFAENEIFASWMKIVQN